MKFEILSSLKNDLKQEDHGPRLVLLSKTADAMQHSSSIATATRR